MKATHSEKYFQVLLFSSEDVDETLVCMCVWVVIQRNPVRSRLQTVDSVSVSASLRWCYLARSGLFAVSQKK